YRLVLRATGVELYGAHQIRARIRRIAITGASVSGEAGPLTERERSARALVGGRWRDALAGPGDDAELGLWRAVAAAELGRFDEAVASFAGLDRGAPGLRMHLRHLLRARPDLALPLLRAGLADELAGLLTEALAEPTRMHLDEELQRVWLRVGGDLEALPADDPAQVQRVAGLLRVRALVWQSLGEYELAGEDVAAAVARWRQVASEPGAAKAVAELELVAAQVAAQRGQTGLAIAAAGRALAGASEPEWMAERMRMDVRLAALRADPAFVRLLAAYP
ncbi:MAG: hypothetical protein JNK56_36250, partial [Myxococcales bacterium]|nr:hypothetical protein [Myxococcales bacterium]